MAAPGVGAGAAPPLFQFHHEYSNNPPPHYHHEYSNNSNNSNPHYYPSPPPVAAASAPPHFLPPVQQFAPTLPFPVPYHNNNSSKKHNRHGGVSSGNHKDRVRTLFISGLPEDVKPREIYNLFRRRPGFETCQLKYTGRGYQIVAFAVFSHQQYALAAKDALNGLTFDPETGATLHIELARANSRIKRSDDGSNGPYDKKIRGPMGVPGVSDDDGTGENVKIQGSNEITHSGGETGASVTSQDGNCSPTMGQPGGNPPCSTLFVANLGPTCTEAELGSVLSRFKGFKMMKMQTKGGMPVAFVDFEDATCSTEALKKLQDTLLPSSDRGGMHLEYAKSRMRYPRQQEKTVDTEIKQAFPLSFADKA
ncbi:U1 small nuclear ribonucleoprotein A isoform X1 [Cryptomeria japonica]|uniref:U1 small nuclear ribonucleoprotein A isoform X1 n=1 Tax=Cryptomeria japonica TaxID=3369 RepID=UPI0025ABE3D7|nr:U1 small nuclear ribonucleoprotein A isoform X1 [Cryptomeria japonica]